MKIYTKTGDKGETSLVSGRRLLKSEALIEAYGTVDELNTFVGDLTNVLVHKDLSRDCTYVQNILFNIGSILARDETNFADYPVLKEIDITFLEKRIDQFNEVLEKMTAFILPAGSPAITKAHICRTVCRRAERAVVRIGDLKQNEIVIRYLNRLSDYFFVLARYCHQLDKIPETKWDNDYRSKITLI